MSDIFERLSAVKTMPELDALRKDVVAEMDAAAKARGPEGFYEVQNAFIKAKNRLKRIPLRERTW